MIDIIIPCYNAHDTIHLPLSSIATQTYAHKARVTLVNDAGNDYADVVKFYSQFIEVREIGYDVNGGPAVARQYGIDNTNAPLIMFIDADDTLMDSLTLQKMFDKIESKHAVLVGGFIEQLTDGKFKTHPQDWVWMFAKIYRRKWLEKKKVRFNKSRANEDMGFNMQVRLQTKPHEVCYYNDRFYVWRFKHDSITRKDEGNYKFYEGVLGVIDNKQEVIERFGIEQDNVRIEAVSSFIDFHFMVQQTEAERPERQDWVQELFDRVKVYYNAIAKDAIAKTSTKDIVSLYKERLSLYNLLPKVTLQEFIEMVEA